MRRSLIAIALLVSFASAAHARGIHARIEGPARDGVTYTVRILGSEAGDQFEPWGSAQGAVDGRPRSVLIRLEPTSDHGVYRFTRTWPEEGQWVLRVSLGHYPAPATVAALRANGSIRNNRICYMSDGSSECYAALKKALKHHPGEDC
jgi:hypothetical protein